MYLNDFKNFIESEKKYSKHTVNAYVNDLDEFNNLLKLNSVQLNEKLN